MRLSIDKNDPGYRPMDELRKFGVFLNGVERTDCHTADEEKGFIRTVRVVRTAPWLPQRLSISPPLKGTVEIRPK